MGTAGLADFDLLEKKITQAADFIEQLKIEKKQIEDANNEVFHSKGLAQGKNLS